jgi:nucleotide-binding universal stress UspA family protein
MDTNKPIVVGVDGSPESVRAAVAGALIARRTGAACHLVHAVPVADYLAMLPSEMSLDAEQVAASAVEGGRQLVLSALSGQIPIEVLETLDVRLGRAAVVMEEAVRRLGAGLIVMGAKRHRGIGLLGGSAITHVLRTCNVPLLATDGSSPNITRILAVVDLSYAAEKTLAVAEEWAERFGAELRVMHAVEPVPVIPGLPIHVGEEEFYNSEQRLLELNVWSRVKKHDSTQTVMRRGHAAAVITKEAERFNADLIVMGSHGKGWAHRLLLGSTTERLLHALPAMTLVVPVARPVGRRVLEGVEMPWEERQTAGV